MLLLLLLFFLQTTHLVVNDAEKAQDSYKSRMAQKWGIPVISTEFIHKCVEAGKLVEADPFVVVGKTATEEFDNGKIVGMYAQEGVVIELFGEAQFPVCFSPMFDSLCCVVSSRAASMQDKANASKKTKKARSTVNMNQLKYGSSYSVFFRVVVCTRVGGVGTNN